jgi:thiamine-monophosphate kinase
MVKLTEFEFIECYITNTETQRSDVVLSVGDDAAIVDVPADKSLVITTDSMIEGRHFLPDTPARVLGYRLLAVNLSDLSAMGAQPAWAMLSLTIPELETDWLDEFFQGFSDLAKKYNVELIGGNTTQGPLNLTLQLHGFVPKNKSLRRSGAKIGDKIIVTGTLGDAFLALQYLRGELKNIDDTQKEIILNKLYYPTPRVELGHALLEHATAAIDISDGLSADLNHILQASDVGAKIDVEKLPVNFDFPQMRELALYTGDAYELCFTIPPDALPWLEEVSKKLAVPIAIIGEIVDKKEGYNITPRGWDHFS